MKKDRRFEEGVIAQINHFNETRGDKEILNPHIVGSIPKPRRKFGSRFVRGETQGEYEEPLESVMERIIDNSARRAVRTLLELERRPDVVSIGMIKLKPDDVIFRVMVPV